MLDVKQLLAECEERMEMSVMHLDETLSHIRAGKANVHILDQVMVNSYGSMVPVNNVAAITTPDSRTIAIKPWDKSMFAPIEKAIIDSNVGIMPENNGEVIRLGIPPLTEERRRDLIKIVKGEGEQGKVAVRNVRRDANDKIKALLKDKEISENEQHKAEEEIQKITDIYIKKVDEVLADKEKELMVLKTVFCEGSRG